MRGYRTDPDFYFGAPGTLVALPWPQGGFLNPVEREVSDFQSGSGNHRVSTLVGTSRIYSITWTALHQETFDKVNRYWLGHQGPGPFAIIDPTRPNLLTPNQSSACGVWRDTTDFTLGGTTQNGTLSANKTTSLIHRSDGTRSLRWLFSGTLVTTPSLLLKPQSSLWPGIPCVAGLPYTLSFWVKPDGVVDSSINVGAHITWYNSAGAVVSTTTLAPAAVTTWTHLSVTGTAPVGAAFGLPAVDMTSSTVTSGGSLYLDEFMYEQDSVVQTWAPGTGVLPVSILGLNEGTSFDALFRVQPSLILREVL